MLDLHTLCYKYRTKNSPLSLSWMSELKMQQGCSVVMGESCKKKKKKKTERFRAHLNYHAITLHSQILGFTQRSELYHITMYSYHITIPVNFLLYVCQFICISLVVLRRGDRAWREVLAVPQSTQGCLIGWSQQGGRVVSQSAHAGDRWLCDWIRNRLHWYRRACCSWGETEETSGIKSNLERSVCVVCQCLRQFQQHF